MTRFRVPSPATPTPTPPRALEDCHTLNDFMRPHAQWMHVVSHLHPRFGGVSAVVPQLGSALALSKNIGVEIAAFCPESEGSAVQDKPELAVSYWPAARGTWLRTPALRARFRAGVQRADGLHLHGLWEGSTSIAAHAARSAGKPYVLSAHGMLDPWALSQKPLKKAIYSALIERTNVQHATCLHALTVSEARDYLSFGTTQPIAIIPNGVTLPEAVDAAPLLARFPALRNRRIVLFLGRLHAKKGLHILLEAWKDVAPLFADATLVVAGPDSEGTRAALESLVDSFGLHQQVVFTGLLEGKLKWAALAAAEAFVLPSFSEGLSVAALEALGMGLPMILTDACHLPEVQQAGAGHEIKAETRSVRDALRAMLSSSAEANRAMGRRGRELFERRYSWTVVAQQMAELYRWVQCGGRVPQLCEFLEARA